jgi:hypothetical protein
MKKLVLALSAIAFVAGSSPSLAATQCRDKSGKFVKCPQPKATAKATAKPTTKPKQCRDKSGKFTKCPK